MKKNNNESNEIKQAIYESNKWLESNNGMKIYIKKNA